MISLKPVNLVCIDNFYTAQELRDIKQELAFLTKNNKLKYPDQTGSSLDEFGEPNKHNRGLWLDAVYADRSVSDILRHTRKIFQVDPSLEEYLSIIANCNSDTTLVSYYENSDYYKAHSDYAALTVLTYIYEEPKAFTGGDLYLPNHDTTLECVSNRVYFLPSYIQHEVTQVCMPQESLDKGLGRYCITQFLHYKM
jgi:Rps23 Pro-64 3,4-dihydroxylase Tpa1-like proline 4-hydroxylase